MQQSFQYENIPPIAKELSRAIASLREELEAVDYYNQRAALTTDAELRGIMIHHRNEEVEHAAMLVEWIRRNVPEFDTELRKFLFKDAPINRLENQADSSGGESFSGLGSLKKQY